MSKTEYTNLQKTLRAPLGEFTPTFVRKVTTKGIIFGNNAVTITCILFAPVCCIAMISFISTLSICSAKTLAKRDE